MPCPHPSTLTLLLLSTIFSFFLPNLTIPAPRCPCDFLLPVSFSPLTPFFPPCPALTPPSCLPPQIVAYLNRSRSVLSHHRTEPKQHCPLLSPQPPHSPTGGDRALPSDYTGGAGLEYSPEGRQLSISDNCRERDTHACAQTHTHIPPCSFVNQGAIT